MKNQNEEKKNVFTKIATVFVPVVAFLLIVSVIICFAFGNNRSIGLLAVGMPLFATALAVAGIVLAVIGARTDSFKKK